MYGITGLDLTYQGVIPLLLYKLLALLDQKGTIWTFQPYYIALVWLDNGDLSSYFWDLHPVIFVPIGRLVILEISSLWGELSLSSSHTTSKGGSNAEKRKQMHIYSKAHKKRKRQ